MIAADDKELAADAALLLKVRLAADPSQSRCSTCGRSGRASTRVER
jgi:hypothetical protein